MSKPSPFRPSLAPTRSGGAVLCALLAAAALLIAAPSAFALSKNTFSTSFAGTGPSALSNPSDVQVDQSTGDVYVTDPADHRVEEFTASGAFILMFGKGVDKTTGAGVCTAQSGDECRSGVPGTAPGSFTDPRYLALDPANGDVYVGDAVTGGGSGDVQKFTSAGALITSWGVGGLLDGSGDTNGYAFANTGSSDQGLTGVTVDAAGNLYVFSSRRYFEFARDGGFVRDFAAVGPLLDGSGLTAGPDGYLYSIQSQGGVHFFQRYPAAGGIGEELAGTAGSGLGIDPLSGDLFLATGGVVDHFAPACLTLGCEPADSFGGGDLSAPEGVAVDDSSGTVYVADSGDHRVAVFDSVPYLPNLTQLSAAAATPTAETLAAAADPAGAGPISACEFQYAPSAAFNEVQTITFSGASGGTFRPDFQGSLPLAPLPYDATAEELQIAFGNIGGFGRGNVAISGPPGGPYRVEFTGALADRNVSELTVDSELTPGGATATVSTLTEGADGWAGAAAGACEQPTPLPAPTEVTAQPGGLEPGTAYFFRLAAADGNGTDRSYAHSFTTLPVAPEVGAESLGTVHADSASINVEVNPNGGEATYPTSYRVEYLTQARREENAAAGEPEFAHAGQGPSESAGSAKTFQALTTLLSGLAPNTVYRYRVVATNASGTGLGAPQTLTTLPAGVAATDPCPNAHVRQQTGAAGLLDCRAYELVSAANSGGYDVESNLIPGQTPFAGYPDATDRLLYGIHGGGLPEIGDPTNRGLDPYVATRGEDGWTTSYVGIPADGTPSTAPFSSTLLEADAGLRTFAFGGPGICRPCFSGGGTTEVGNPLRQPDGELVQAMTGSIPQPAAEPAGVVAKHLSAGGTHFIFGSTSKFEPDGNEGEVSIYDRNLSSGETHVVSKTPAGTTMTGPGIAELDISADGSRVLLGRLVSESGGARYWHLYMNVGDSLQTIDLTPGTTHGVLYDGMTSDGSKVFFTTVDPLTADDEDESADIYRADVSSTSATLTRVSTGIEGTGDTDSCDPVADSAHPHWNTTGSEANCGVVAIGGGGGVATGDGTIYFLSPEQLDGPANGTQNAPNLYVARPGSAPRFVTTLESVLTGPQPPAEGRSLIGSFGSFSAATGLAVDNSTGDVYVMDSERGVVEKFDSAGEPVSFSFSGSASYVESNKLTGTPSGGFEGFAPYPTTLAVDQSNGDFYVPDLFHNVVDKFAPSGEYLSEFQVSVNFPTAVAVDPNNGNVYVTSLFGSVEAFESSGVPLPGSSFSAPGPAGIAVTAGGGVYVSSESGTDLYESGTLVRQLDPHAARGLTIDSSDGDIYVNEGGRVAQFDSTGTELGAVGAGSLSSSDGVAVDPGGKLYASNGTTVAAFGKFGLLPSPAIDNPLVLDAVGSPSTRDTADFQVTPSGDYAAFPSTLALAGNGEDTGGHTVLYRYDAASGALDCASCSPTGTRSAGDSSLAQDGLSLTEDGRLFFNSADQLASADTDGRRDVYEWAKPGAGNCSSSSPSFATTAGSCLALISAGTSPFDSGLLSATENGTDTFFFTRDSLAPQDKNGPTMKIYDAREGGGFPYSSPEASCKASDECHGAATGSPAPPAIGSVAGIAGNLHAPRCKKGYVKKHHRCVKAAHHKRHRPGKHHRKKAKGHHGGAK
jgi:DNA-binding beta-propeller fold protein YncE